MDWLVCAEDENDDSRIRSPGGRMVRSMCGSRDVSDVGFEGVYA